MNRMHMNHKMGHPKITSEFICLKCLQKDLVAGNGMQRMYRQREENHIKDLWCCRCKEITKTLEVRYFESVDDKLEEAIELRTVYYDYIDGEYILKEEYNKK